MMGEYVHPAEREAERLRVIIETLATTSPDMTMFTAAPTIFEIEKKTAELERVQVQETLDTPGHYTGAIFHLPDNSPETAARFVAICPPITDFLPHKKINAIKELRARTGLGLKEAKDGIEHFERYGTAAGPAPATASSSGAFGGKTPTAGLVADWIATLHVTHPIIRHIEDVMHGSGSSPKIKAIKEVRADCPMYPGLKEAKEGVEEFLSRAGYRPSSVF
jgi:ribosomal protein L7/L12